MSAVVKKSMAAVVVLILLVLGVLLWQGAAQPENKVNAITRDGVVTEIQNLARLTSVAFSVDTIISAQKAGTWYKLWQDEQKGLFVARGKVLAGVDLSKISSEMVQVRHETLADGQSHTYIDITLPPSEVFEVFLDDIQVYDWRTGLLGMVDNDPELLTQAQAQGKAEVLEKACQGDVMSLALANASQQVESLFLLTGATVTITNQGTGACQLF